MAKFCGNCGARLDDSARVCGRCGAPLGGYTPPKWDPNPNPKPHPKKSTLNPKLKKFIPLIAAAVVVIAVLVGVIRYNSPASVAQRYLKASFTDSKRASSMLAYDDQARIVSRYDGDEEVFFENQSNWLDEDITSWKDYYKAKDASNKEGMEDELGRYTIKTEARKVKDVSAKKIRSDYEYWLDELEDSADFDRDKIKEGKRVTVKLTIKGEDDTERRTVDVVLVRTGLTWKVLTGDN